MSATLDEELRWAAQRRDEADEAWRDWSFAGYPQCSADPAERAWRRGAVEKTFRTLRAILKKHAGHMRVTADTDKQYSLDAGYSARWKKEIYFGGVRLGKAYVSYHLMPVYTCPELLRGLSPELKKRMQGKSCFNFRTISREQALELSELTRRSVERFAEVAQLEAAQTKPRGGRTRRCS